MISITNPRVAGFSPRWNSFRGFTLLFDNPGDSLADWQGYQLVAGDIADNAELEFYRGLRSGLEEIGLKMLMESYLFCPLSPSTYHVTAWDCLNDGNVTQAHPQHIPDLMQTIAELPASLQKPNTATRLPLASELIAKENWNIRFRFDRLYKWSNFAMVVLLKPDGEESEANYQSFIAARARLNAEFRQTFGIGARELYLPHVTLGYFANAQAAQMATPCMEEWNATMATHARDLNVKLDSVSLYGFVDLEHFFKNPT
jgi:hypothetical protein